MKLAKLLIAFSLLVVPFFAMSPTQNTYAADNGLFNQVCNNKNGNGQSTSTVCKDAQNQKTGSANPVAGKNGLLNGVTRILSVIGAVAAVILIVLSGLTMVTSAGNSEKVASARRRLVYAVVGLIVIGLANIMVNFVIDKFV